MPRQRGLRDVVPARTYGIEMKRSQRTHTNVGLARTRHTYGSCVAAAVE